MADASGARTLILLAHPALERSRINTAMLAAPTATKVMTWPRSMRLVTWPMGHCSKAPPRMTMVMNQATPVVPRPLVSAHTAPSPQNAP